MSANQERKPNAAEASDAQNPQSTDNQNVPTLGALDEDDEFEEFENSETVTATAQQNGSSAGGPASVALDMSGSARSGGDHLWEDNWDDDDIEDDFSNALRAELAKSNAPEAMTA